MQLRALNRAGCDVVYTDQGISGALFERPGLRQALRRLRPGDTLVVWKLDRLGRSLNGLVQVVASLGKRQVQFASLSESIDTATAGGRLIFHLMGALAEFERSLISERTKAGMDAARCRGLHVGRPRALTAEQLGELAVHLGQEPLHLLAKRFGVHPRTLRRYMAMLESDEGADASDSPAILPPPPPPPSSSV